MESVCVYGVLVVHVVPGYDKETGWKLSLKAKFEPHCEMLA